MGKWRRTELSPALCTIIAGSTPPTSDERYWGGDNVWITPNDLSSLNGHIISDSERKLSDLGVKRATGKALPAQSVIISCRAPVGYCAVASAPFTTNQGCKSLTCHGIDETYLYYYLSRSTALLERVSSGTTFLELPKKELARFQVDYPEATTEQRKIAEVLTAVDEAIDKTRALIEKYTNIKAGMVQDLLGSGEQVPFEKIINVCFDYRGRTPKKLGMDWGNGDIPALSANNVTMGKIDFSKPTNYGSTELYKRWMTNGDIHKGYILFTMEAPLGNVAKVEIEQRYILSQRTIAIDCNREYCINDFLYHYLMSAKFQRYIALYASGTTAKGIQRKQLYKLIVTLPKSIEKQQRIADMLTAADERIQTERDYLTKLQDIKLGLMQDLFDPNGVSVDALM
jgi:type I restriction enzyme S subunit